MMSRPQRDTEAGEPRPVRPHRGSKVPSERVVLLVVCALLAAALIVIYRLSSVIEILTNKKLPLKENEPLKHDTCLICDEGWEQHGGRCYYFYTYNSAWKESRKFCRSKGGDLVKIDSREEQSFLDIKLGEIMMQGEDKFWIGLTDSETEDTWTWVDGSTLNTSLAFWYPREPDNWTGENTEGEDCVRMGELGGRRDLKTWFDRSCDFSQKRVCEKPAEQQQHV